MIIFNILMFNGSESMLQPRLIPLQDTLDYLNIDKNRLKKNFIDFPGTVIVIANN
jgi:hypothetical protein